MPVAQDRDIVAPSPERRARARERVLRQAVDDLTAEIRDLRAQRDAISEAYEQLRAGVAAPAGAGQALSPPPQQPGSAALLRRAAKGLIRGTLGSVRRLWRVADPAQRFVVDLRLAREPAAALPSITVVVDAGADAGRASDRLAALAAQTAEQLEVAVWDRGSDALEVRSPRGVDVRRAAAASRDELLSAVTGSYLATLGEGVPELPTTLFETLQWLLSSEDLAYVRVFAPPVDDDGDPPPQLLLCRRELWQLDGIDLAGLAARAARRPVLGKTIGLTGRLDAAVPRLATLGPGSGRLVCRTGRYDVWAGSRSGPVPHQARSLSAGPDAGNRDRPALLVLAAVPMIGGAAGLVAATVRELRGSGRCVVVSTAADHALGAARALQLERLGATVYELGSTLPPEIWGSAVDRIATGLTPGAVLAVGHDPRLDGAVGRLQAGGARIVALPVGDGPSFGGADARIVADDLPGRADAPRGEAEDQVPVPAGWILEVVARGTAPQQRQRVRSELGVPEDRRLVVAVTDLVAAGRPEDVVVVADLLRREPGLCFVLVGDGPLAGSIRDLISFLAVDTLHLRRPRHSLAELAAAADLVLDPSSEPVARPLVAAALAAGTPVVTARGGGAGRLLTETGGGVVVGSIGAPHELAAAVRQVLADGRRPAQERALGILARQHEAGSDAIRRVLRGAAAAASGG